MAEMRTMRSLKVMVMSSKGSRDTKPAREKKGNV